MRQARHITFEKERSRYIFQMRIPTAIRGKFGGRTTVRVALGNISEADALQQGAALTNKWQAKFGRAQAIPQSANGQDVVTLELDTDTVARAVTTWRAWQVSILESRLVELRQLNDDGWDAEILLARRSLDIAKRASRRGSTEAAEAALDALGRHFAVRFKAEADEMTEWIEACNTESLRFAKDRIAVLEGDVSLGAFKAAPALMLPLVRFFGTRARELEDMRVTRLSSIGKPVRPKTHAKFERIAVQLGEVLGERPVECLRPQDVAQLLEIWQKHGNATTTIIDKLSILTGLLQPVSTAAAEVCIAARPATDISRARRYPLSAEQLADFRQYVEVQGRHPDDARLLDVMLLTGARLGEVLQLNTSDIHPADSGYIVSLRASLTLKTPSAVRDLPILVQGMPELETWLKVRLAQGGALFPDARADVYGHYGSAESKRLNRMLRKGVTTDRQIVLQSTRNTVGRALRRGGVDSRVRRRYLGHTDVDIHDKHYDPAELLGAEDLLVAAPVLNALAVATRPVLNRPGAEKSGRVES